MKKRVYGYKPDAKDDRDVLYTLSFKGVQLPAEVDLRRYCSNVQDQGPLGSCLGWALADGMREFLLQKLRRRLIEMSPLYIYYHARDMEGMANRDAGASLRDGLKVLASLGCATEKDWPYDIEKFAVPPSEEAEEGARDFRIHSYHRLYNLADIKACLAEGFGAAIGFMVRQSFEKIGPDGEMPMPRFWERTLGGHATFVCGYNDGAERLIIKNSYGPDWGDGGYFYMPYQYVKPRSVIDIWTAR